MDIGLIETIAILKNKINELETKFNTVETKFNTVETKFTSIENQHSMIEGQLISASGILGSLAKNINCNDSECTINKNVIVNGTVTSSNVTSNILDSFIKCTDIMCTINKNVQIDGDLTVTGNNIKFGPANQEIIFATNSNGNMDIFLKKITPINDTTTTTTTKITEPIVEDTVYDSEPTQAPAKMYSTDYSIHFDKYIDDTILNKDAKRISASLEECREKCTTDPNCGGFRTEQESPLICDIYTYVGMLTYPEKNHTGATMYKKKMINSAVSPITYSILSGQYLNNDKYTRLSKSFSECENICAKDGNCGGFRTEANLDTLCDIYTTDGMKQGPIAQHTQATTYKKT